MSALLHRARELATAKDALAPLDGGSPAVLVIEGGRGSGKSALLQAVLGLAPAAALTLRARCHAAERDFAFGAVGQLFDPLADADGLPNGTEHDLLRGYYLRTRALAAARPVVIAVDDLQHADCLSARWCSYLARRLDDLPVALIVTVDTGTAPRRFAPVAELRDELAALTYTRPLRAEPLDAADAAELMAGVLGRPPDPVFAVRCHEAAHGNPRILKAIAARLSAMSTVPAGAGLAGTGSAGTGSAGTGSASTGPASTGPAAASRAAADTAARATADVVLDWVRHSDPGVADLFEQFAVSPTGSMETAAMLLGVGDDVATAARATFRRYGLLADRSPDQFADPAMRAAILDRLSPQALTDMHRRAATMLSRIGAPAITVAEHVMAAGAQGEPWARPALRRAAHDAQDNGDWPAASRYLNRVLLELDDAVAVLPVMAELGAVEYHTDVKASLRRVLTVAGLPADPTARDAALAAFAEPLLALESDAAAARFRRAAARLADEPSADPAAQLRLAAQSLLSARGTGVRAAMRRVREGADDAAARQLLTTAALSIAVRGRGRGGCVSLARRGMGVDPARGGSPQPSTGALAALALTWAGEFGPAAEACAQALEGAKRQASVTTQALALLVRAEIGYLRGRLGTAAADLRHARTLCERAAADGLGAVATAALVRVLLASGEDDAVPPMTGTFDSNGTTHPFVIGIGQESRGMIAASRGDHRQALRLYLECGRRLGADGLQNPACSAWRSRAVVTMVGLGKLWEATTLGDAEVELARSWGAPGPLSRALAAAATTRELPQRLEMLREAVDVLDGTECTLDLARAKIRFGRAQFERGDVSGARASLRRGLDIAVSCGMRRLAAAARQALQAAGGGSAENNGHPVLTASELRVADLVIQGLGNQEVAEKLSISKRTVDTHLGRIYRKLHISGRNRLRDALRAAAEG